MVVMMMVIMVRAIREMIYSKESQSRRWRERITIRIRIRIR